ncbi:uncharacterized protein EV422DRAFT_571922 [Fimicolochytrium jonesii]|uniref:uncharacterized protein n=1 Tax=Fimicolochytrium jonesii TaxID=1396493 RepID=UPI0022FF270E|nr:uncharacterized protein EV422DRAFT_571922 [Fimicolochytrium jonesii]KAI8816355.1 hypothetical protein EV422DRAFT_571922 [Fimicolochytrium jonesii]
MSQRSSTTSSRRSSVADLSNAVSKPPILRPTTRTKNQRTDSPVPGTPVRSVYPNKPIEVDSAPQIDRGFREATGSRTPAPVKATGNKRPPIRSPRITVQNAGDTPADTRKKRKVLDTPEERRRGEAIIGSATLSVSGLDPEEDEFTSETLTRDVEYLSGDEEEYYGAEKNGAVCMCENPDDSASIYGRVLQCKRGDLCCGSQFYHPECLNNKRLPHPQEEEEVLQDYFAQYNFVCPPCLEDLPENAETDGKITATKHPNVGKKRGLRLVPYDHENRKWKTDFTMKTGEGDMEEGRPYRVSGRDIETVMLPSQYNEYTDVPSTMYTHWEKELILKQAVFVVITNLEPHYTLCAKALRKEHGIHETRDDLEDPKALLRQAAFPRIDQPNYLIYAGPNLWELEIIVASFGPKPKDKPEDQELTFGVPRVESELWSSLALKWLATGDLGSLKPKGWRTPAGEAKHRGSPRFRTQRGHPAVDAQAVIHGGVWTTTTSGGETNKDKLPCPTAESRHIRYSLRWVEYLDFAENATAHKRMAICHKWIDPASHARRRSVIDNLPAQCQRNIPAGSPGTMCVINFNVTVHCHVNPNDHGFTVQYVHGSFSAGDLAFRNLHLCADTTSGTITLVHAQVEEHTVLDWGPLPGRSWTNTWRFSQPTTTPRDVLHAHSRKELQESWAKYRGSSWPTQGLNIAQRPKTDVNFNPQYQLETLKTSLQESPDVYIGHASIASGDEIGNPDQFNVDRRNMLSRYTEGVGDFAPIARLKQQEAARRAHASLAASEHTTLDDIFDAIVARYPTTPPTSPPQPPRPALRANITPGTRLLLKYQHVVPLPESDANEILRRWWLEVRTLSAEARLEPTQTTTQRTTRPSGAGPSRAGPSSAR